MLRVSTYLLLFIDYLCMYTNHLSAEYNNILIYKWNNTIPKAFHTVFILMSYYNLLYNYYSMDFFKIILYYYFLLLIIRISIVRLAYLIYSTQFEVHTRKIILYFAKMLSSIKYYKTIKYFNTYFIFYIGIIFIQSDYNLVMHNWYSNYT